MAHQPRAAIRRSTPVAVFRRPHSAAIVWKQAFTKTPGEFVAGMVLVHDNDRYLVDHAMVFSGIHSCRHRLPYCFP
jgi:hypothetical protein